MSDVWSGGPGDSVVGRQLGQYRIEATIGRGRFRRESKLAAAIDHPNIIPVYEADTAGEVLYLAMRYVEGTDLRAVIAAEDGGIGIRRAARIVGQIAGALD